VLFPPIGLVGLFQEPLKQQLQLWNTKEVLLTLDSRKLILYRHLMA
jgi:hypothetical protein